MQITIVAFGLLLFVSLCFGRPGRAINKNNKSDNSSSAATFRSGHYDNNAAADNAADNAPTPPKGRDEDDDEGENTYSYDDKGAGVYEKLDEIMYPFQQYIQVRHSYSVEHHPIKEESDDDGQPPDSNSQHKNTESASSNFAPVKKPLYKKRHRSSNKGRESRRNRKQKLNLDTSASTRNENQNHEREEDEENQGNDDENSDDGGEEDYESQSSYKEDKPRLKEEVADYKKQEVYEEKGYGDAAYDHEEYGARKDHTYYDKGRNNNDDEDDRGENREENENQEEDDGSRKYHNSEQDQPSSSSSTHKKTKSRPKTQKTEESRNNKKQESRNYYRKNPPKQPHLSELPEARKLLEYAASNLYDKDAHEKGIYAARANIHCPEVIDFDLSSKKMGMGKGGNNPRGARPRLTGLGSKIKCLKEKYWGVEPLPRQIFLDPAESRVSAIKIPSFDQFYKSFRDEVDSISDFQHF